MGLFFSFHLTLTSKSLPIFVQRDGEKKQKNDIQSNSPISA